MTTPAPPPVAPGHLVVVSGPSGAGKSTLLTRVLEQSPLSLTVSTSATTRPPRPGEIDGESYHFLSVEEFETHRQAGDFLECKEVYGRGYWYGTLRIPVTTGLEAGKWVILEIDVEGALDVLRQIPGAITIFIHPGSLAELERRLRSRATESEDSIEQRLAEAGREMEQAATYQHRVINDNLDRAVQELCDILAEQGE
ncbi:MAG: guanylate kinase [Pirellulaceae bacterium]